MDQTVVVLSQDSTERLIRLEITDEIDAPSDKGNLNMRMSIITKDVCFCFDFRQNYMPDYDALTKEQLWEIYQNLSFVKLADTVLRTIFANETFAEDSANKNILISQETTENSEEERMSGFAVDYIEISAFLGSMIVC